MKFNFKKISAVFAGALMAGMAMGGAVSAANYPSPFQDNVANTAVVYGSDALSSDESVANSIQADLAEFAEGSTSGSASIGDESVTLEDGELYLGDALDETFDDRDFDTLLSEETLADDNDDISDIDYKTEIALNINDGVEFSELDEDEYYVHSDKAEDELPVLNIDMSDNGVYDVDTDFYTSVDFTEYDDSESITIAGQELVIDPNLADEAEDVLTFFESSDTVTLESGDSQTVDGKEIEVTGGVIDSQTVNLVIDGSSYSGLEAGDEEEGVYVKDVAASDVGDTSTLQAELMVGSAEWEIDQDELDIDDETVDGVSVSWEQSDGTYNHSNVEGLTFSVNPSEMDEDYLSELLGIDVDDDPEDKVQKLEIGGEFIDPVFGFGMFFEGSEPEVGEGDSDLDFTAGGDTLTVDFTNRNGVEYSIGPYEYGSDGSVHIGEDWFVSDNNESDYLQNMTEDDIFIVGSDEKEDEVTYIYQVDDIDAGEDGTSDEITLVNVGDGSTRTYRNGDEIEDSELYLSEISGDGEKFNILNDSEADTAFDGAYDASDLASIQNEIVTENEVGITFNDLPQNGSQTNLTSNDTVISLEEDRDDELDENSDDFGTMNVTVTSDTGSDEELQISNVAYNETYQDVASSSETDMEYSVSKLGTYTELDQDDDASFNVWSPEEQVEYKVSLATLGEAEEDDSGETGAMLITDAEVDDYEDHSLIVVGGSCVNEAAADLLGVDYKTCGEDFTEATGVGSGEALIKGYTDSDLTSEHAVLVAGYSADDTNNAAKYLMNEDVDTSEEYTVSSATEATMTSSE